MGKEGVAAEKKDEDFDADQEEKDLRERAKSATSPDQFFKVGVEEMMTSYKTLLDSIAKHLTLSVNLKTFGETPITLHNGETHQLFKLASITMRNANTIAINFADNLEAIKAARLALQSSADNTNIQQDGFMLYVPVPKITRERREELAKKVSAELLKEYKLVLHQLYSKYSKRIDDCAKNEELKKRLLQALLQKMRSLVIEGETKCKERSKALLSEAL